MERPLRVYKASAGSGKTFTIAYDYIHKLIDSPLSASEILAVTFTNKATGEMKQRILSQLFGLWKRLDDAETRQFMRNLCRDTELSEPQVSRNAGVALRNILYNYNSFQVETIDAFFQTVLRNLARELNLSPNLKVDLNENEVEDKAVDSLIDNLGPGDDELRWILDYIGESISDDKNWNIIGQLKTFGRNIFKDVYKNDSEALNKVLTDKEAFDAYLKSMYAIKKEAERRMREPVETFNAILDAHGFSISDFSRGERGVCSYFLKLGKGVFDSKTLVTATVEKALDSAEAWVTKAHAGNDDPLFMLVCDELQPLLRRSEDERAALYRTFKSAQTTLQNMHNMRLLNAIGMKIKEMNAESNRFFLSDTQTLLHGMMKDSDSPFVFEKIGSRIEHILIDEFQDTGTVQWSNFKILLLECMSHAASRNLIVGDIKQSIYRWRSGDWKLLFNISGEFPSAKEQLEFIPLDVNYRSEPEIVHFNNEFFKKAAAIESSRLDDEGVEGAEQIEEAYADVEQKSSRERNADGFVMVRFLDKEGYRDATLRQTAETIHTLLDAGYSMKSIAVIVRKNSDIQSLGEYLSVNMPDVAFVSDEAFRLDSSSAVMIVTQALQYLVTPDDDLLAASLARAYQSVLGNVIDSETLMGGGESLRSMLPAEFLASADEIVLLPLNDLVNRLFHMFALDRDKGEGQSILNEQSAYVCTFVDYMSDFIHDNGSDIMMFLNYWNESLAGKTIQSDEVGGVSLITIHKSKGLQYDNVIMPFCDWTLEKPNNVVWCKPEGKPFDTLPIVPVNYSGTNMKETIYEKGYAFEHLQNTMDNLNLLYVGFTRARRNLFVFTKLNDKQSNRSYIIQQVLTEQGLLNIADGGGGDDGNGSAEVSVGKFCMPPEKKTEKAETRNIFLTAPSKKTLTLTVNDTQVEFRQSNKSREFVSGDDDDDDGQKHYIKTGNIMHKIFSMIETPADIDRVLDDMEGEGVLYGEGLSKEKVSRMIHKRLEHGIVADWFSGRWRLYNEHDILTGKEEGGYGVNRPDRVMMCNGEVVVVDFKFGKHNCRYNTQVRRYMDLLQEMGYDNVKGYLWYVYTDDVECV